MLNTISALALLGVCSLDDIRRKQIRTGVLFLFAAWGIFGHFLSGGGGLWEFAAAFLPGGFLLFCSFVTRGGVGVGDGLLLLVLGIFAGAETTVWVLLCALFFAAFCALFLCVICKKRRDYEMPFVPFLLLAYGVIHIWEEQQWLFIK